jgi:steroid 5-alpha reductase family enzyme
MIAGLVTNAAVLCVAMIALWAFAVRIGDVSFIDAVWGGGMALLAATSWWQLIRPGWLATSIAAMAMAWGLRLAVYLLRRWRREGEDKRYARILRRDREAGRFALGALTRVFAPQAVLLFLVCLPAQMGILANPAGDLTLLAVLGVSLYLVGIFFEWLGDWQLAQFRAREANRDKVMDRGLWRYTRHPNYFGDACAWWGIWLAAASAGWPVALASLAGPLFLTFTLTRWSGKPLLEKGMAERRPGYADYVRRTSGFVPLPPRRR